jgi:hypothetical protein
MSITPTPPAPELPKTEPGQVDNSVPQEIEIEIKHNGGNVGSPANTENTSLDVQSSAQSSPTMPPLPDIK